MRAYINNKPFDFDEEITILEAARKMGFFIPTLCAFQPLNHTPGTCAVCIVRVIRADGQELTLTSCKTPLEDGMHVDTISSAVKKLQRKQVELLFADHEQDCVTCGRYGNCELLQLARNLGVKSAQYTGKFTAKRTVDTSDLAIQLDGNKCVRCMRCVEVCNQLHGIGALRIDNIGTSAGVCVNQADKWIDSNLCVRCGQCIMVCPTGALMARDNVEQARELLEDEEVITVVQFAPAVRATLGDAFGLLPGTNVEKRIITGLKMMGANYILDTNFSADMVIMEEGTELLGRLNDPQAKLPMFTSCCPAWINYVEQHIPELLDHISSTRSPQAVMGSMVKTWFAEKIGKDSSKIRMISIMPCTAKKVEAARPQLAKDGVPDTDLVLTVRELARLFQSRGIDLKTIPDGEFDTPFMSQGTGAAVIFGKSGGVAEAAARTLYHVLTGGEVNSIPFHAAKNPYAFKEAELELGGKTLHIGVVYGLANAREVARQVLDGTSSYDFIEVMTCPGGCVNGGGTFRKRGKYLNFTEQRFEALEKADENCVYRQSHNNLMVQQAYREFFGEPNSHKAHKLLHTTYDNRKKEPAVPSIREVWHKIKLG